MARGADANASVDEVADELYGLPVDEFTATRNARAKQARDGGDREAAAAIGKLGKPNAAAWLANRLVREHGDDVGSLIALGESMRDATATLDRDRLRTLSGQQRTLLAELLHVARALATAAGQKASEEAIRGLEGTLHAALADADAAEQLAAGRLTGTLHSSGFPVGGGFGGTGAAPPRTQPTGTGATKPTGKSQRPAAPERDEQLARAEADAAAATAARDEARADLDAANKSVRDGRSAVDRLTKQLDQLVSELKDAERALRDARAKADRAERVARQAEKALAEAKTTGRRHG